MMMRVARFNIYLWLAVGLLLGGACRTEQQKKERKEKKEVALINLHMEVNQDGASDNAPVPIGQRNPALVNLQTAPFLTSADLMEAKLLEETNGLFMIQLKFNEWGTDMLQFNTTAYQGKRIGVFCKFDSERWLASPVIRRPIKDGVLTFTPDATHEEAEHIVHGLNNATKELKKMDKL